MFAKHDEVHLNLRPTGKWCKPNRPKDNDNEGWAKVEDYMGLFEHCEVMIDDDLIDLKTFNAIFSYRLENLLDNETIVEAKLIEEGKSWQGFIRLLKKLEVESELNLEDFNYNINITNEFLTLVKVLTKSNILSKIKSTVLAIDSDAEIILFGSRARGDFKKDSDWDLLILLNKKLDEDLEDQVRRSLYKVELEFEEVVSPVIENKKVWSQLKVTPLFQNIKNEGIEL